jgi:hypothetical protein
LRTKYERRISKRLVRQISNLDNRKAVGYRALLSDIATSWR